MTDTQIDRESHTHTHTHTHTHRGRLTHSHTTDRQTDEQTDLDMHCPGDGVSTHEAGRTHGDVDGSISDRKYWHVGRGHAPWLQLHVTKTKTINTWEMT